jgi:DNA-binding CsgD family transcriptional regulator
MSMSGPRATAPYLGREVELERLSSLLARAQTGSGSFAIVSATAGSGVTRTLGHVAERAGELGFEVISGACAEGLGPRPLAALADGIEAYAQRTEGAILGSDLDAAAPALARLAPGIRSILPGIPPPAPLGAAAEKLRLLDGILTWLTRLASRRPVLLLVDDLQWADDDLRVVLDHLAPHVAGLSMLVLGGLNPAAERPSFAEMDARDSVRVELSGLDLGALRSLLVRETDAHLTTEAVALIHQASAGHPLTAQQLHAHLREEGRIGRPGGDRLPDPDELPATLGDIVAWRLARLSREQRIALGALACFAGPASALGVSTVSGLTRSRAAEELERSVGSGLVEKLDNGHFAFQAAVLAKFVLESVAPALRAEALGRVARAIEDEVGTDTRHQAAVLADLHGRSVRGLGEAGGVAAPGRAAAGIRHALVAAEQARAAACFGRAADCLALALELAEDGQPSPDTDLRARLSNALAEADRADQSVVAARSALAALGTRPDPAITDTLFDTVRALRDQGRSAEAEQVRHSLGALAGATKELSSARLELLADRWMAAESGAVRTLVWPPGDELLEKSVLDQGSEQDLAELFAHQRPRDHEQTVALLSVARGWRRPVSLLTALHGATVDLSSRLGLFGEALSWAGEYIAAATRFGSPLDQLRATLLVGQCQATLGDFISATEALAAADEIATRLPPAHRLPGERLSAELALAHYRDGDWPSLAGRAATAAAGGTAHGLLMGAEASLAYGRAGDAGRSDALLHDTLAMIQDWPPLTYLRDGALMVALTTAWENGWAQHALVSRSLAVGAASAGAGGNHAATPALAEARAHALAGRLEDARPLFDSARLSLDEAGRGPLRAIVDHDEAIALAAAGARHHGTAGELLERAAGAFGGLGMDGWLTRTRRLMETGFDAAAQPGGRLHFTYPFGLSRREAELVRQLASGTSLPDASAALELEPASASRHLERALEKLGASSLNDLPRLARQHGLGGGA